MNNVEAFRYLKGYNEVSAGIVSQFVSTLLKYTLSKVQELRWGKCLA